MPFIIEWEIHDKLCRYYNIHNTFQSKIKNVSPPILSQTQRLVLCCNKILLYSVVALCYQARVILWDNKVENLWCVIVLKAGDAYSLSWWVWFSVFSKKPTASIQAPACHFRILWSLLGVCWKISQSKQLFEHMVTISKKYKLKIQDQLKWKDLKQQAFKYSVVF